MGIYREQVVPRMIDVILGNPEFSRVRAEVCAGLHGEVLEVGFGSGRNVAHLPPEVTRLWAVEPSRVGVGLAAKRIATSTVPVVTAGADAARLDFTDDRFDAALSTATLCTVPDVEGALRELRRVLKPGARFHFGEHGRSVDHKVARRQNRFTPLQRRVAGGCNLNRDIPALLTGAGFEIESLRNFYLKGPKAWGYMYVGRARNPSSYTCGSPEG